MDIFLPVLSILNVLFLTIGFGMISFGGLLFLLDKSCQSKASHTQGVIVGMCYDANKYNKGNANNMEILTVKNKIDMRYPLFMYWVNGIEYRRAGIVRCDISEIEQDINQQAKVDVYYNIDTPEQSWMQKQSPLTILRRKVLRLGIILLALGVVSLIISFTLF